MLWLLVPYMIHIVFALIRFDVENVLIMTRHQKCSDHEHVVLAKQHQAGVQRSL